MELVFSIVYMYNGRAKLIFKLHRFTSPEWNYGPFVLVKLSSAAFSRYLINTLRLRYVLKSLSARSQLPRRFPIQNAWRSPVTTIRHVRNVVTPVCLPPSSCGMRFLRRACCLCKRKVGHQSSAKISALPGDLDSLFSLLPPRRSLWCTSRPYLS